MANELKRFDPNFTKRTAPKNGPFSSDKWNDTMEELAIDLATLSAEWNNYLLSLANSLPRGTKDTGVNAFVNGIDGDNLWVDGAATASDFDTTFYNSALDRPYTIKESIENARLFVQQQVDLLRSDFIENTAGLSTAQKSAIGLNIFDTSYASSDDSLDGMTANNELNLSQLAEDLYGNGLYTLDKDGSGNLTNPVSTMVGALLTLHGGTWSSDASVDHVLDHDVEVTDSTKGIILKSPDGTRWRITVDNAGAISAAAA